MIVFYECAPTLHVNGIHKLPFKDKFPPSTIFFLEIYFLFLLIIATVLPKGGML